MEGGCECKEGVLGRQRRRGKQPVVLIGEFEQQASNNGFLLIGGCNAASLALCLIFSRYVIPSRHLCAMQPILLRHHPPVLPSAHTTRPVLAPVPPPSPAPKAYPGGSSSRCFSQCMSSCSASLHSSTGPCRTAAWSASTAGGQPTVPSALRRRVDFDSSCTARCKMSRTDISCLPLQLAVAGGGGFGVGSGALGGMVGLTKREVLGEVHLGKGLGRGRRLAALKGSQKGKEGQSSSRGKWGQSSL